MIKDFEQDAICLVHKLAQSLNLEIDIYLPVNTFRVAKGINQVGMIDENWSYQFHGLECRFSHSKSGHTVDVKLKFENEYGALDPMFLGEYIKTNPKYVDTNIKIESSYHDGCKIMDVLEKQNMLLDIQNNAQICIGIINDQPYYVPYNCRGVKLKPTSLC